LRIVDTGLRGPQSLLRLVEQDLGGEAALEQRLLAIEVVADFHQLSLCRGKRRLGRPQGVELVLRVEPRQHLIRLDLFADVGAPSEDAAADTERQRGLVLGADLSRQNDLLANMPLLGGRGPNWARRRRIGLGSRLATGEQDRDRGGKRQRTKQL